MKKIKNFFILVLAEFFFAFTLGPFIGGFICWLDRENINKSGEPGFAGLACLVGEGICVSFIIFLVLFVLGLILIYWREKKNLSW